MSTVETNSAAAHGHDNHDPHLAHHFDTPEQQFQSAKLGMWVFLGTEILMFGALFCAYSVYRHNHPDVFAVAHEALDRTLGAINTLVLITSSLTMAWAVRCAQLGQQRALRWLMAVTLIGGYGFLGIKAVEYHTKWEHNLFFGHWHNTYYGWDGKQPVKGFFQEELENQSANGEQPAANGSEAAAAPEKAPAAAAPAPAAAPAAQASANPASGIPEMTFQPGSAIDGNAGTNDQAKIVATFADPRGVAPHYATPAAEPAVNVNNLTPPDAERMYTFFAVYFFMTGLHGLHVVIGMSVIYWVLLRAGGPQRKSYLVPAAPISVGLFLTYLGIIIPGPSRLPLLVIGISIAVAGALWAVLWSTFGSRVPAAEPEFGPNYFTPVDLAGLYWHLVDMVWIFLFPLLYLIH